MPRKIRHQHVKHIVINGNMMHNDYSNYDYSKLASDNRPANN